MPELPEVETIRLQLKKYLIGHRMSDVELRYSKKFEGNSKNIIGGKVTEVKRFGKALVIDLDNHYSMVIHIKLTGQLIYRGPNLKNPNTLSEKVKDGLEGKHTHIIFHLDKSGKLYFNDVRKFGWIKIVKSEELKVKSDFLRKLGPEPLIDEDNPPENILTKEKFTAVVRSTTIPIKVLLMDQRKMAGIGNIYANDALWLAKIDPRRKSSSLKTKEIDNLFQAIGCVLKKGIEKGGASELSFVTPDGSEGEYQNHTLAYDKEGEICTRCNKGKFKKIKLSGRGTYFCPVCQK